ncbi:MAG: helix-turn-helix transcriptional regulator [Comamonas sp.]
MFHEAAVLLVTEGRLDLDDGLGRLSLSGGASASLLLVAPGTCADLLKTPSGPAPRFRSLFLTLAAPLIEAYCRDHAAITPDHGPHRPCRQVPLDPDLESALRWVIDSVETPAISDPRLRHRLMDLLLALAERGHAFKAAPARATAYRLRTLMSEAPDRPWTAHEAGHELAMSAATLRRRLAAEGARFEDVLVDIRMHHALMLLQTTAWNIPRVALACGYQSRARFSERFRQRFGHLPSAVR